MPTNTNEQEEHAAQIASLHVLQDLFERHDTFAKGYWEPVYGKKVHIGDTCSHCGTHFNGLKDDIRLTVEHEVKKALASQRKSWGQQAARHFDVKEKELLDRYVNETDDEAKQSNGLHDYARYHIGELRTAILSIGEGDET